MPRHVRTTIASLRLTVVALAGVCLGFPPPTESPVSLPLLPFQSDADIRALACPLQLTGSLPSDLATAGCQLSPQTLPLSRSLRSVLVRSSHEHDGMYGVREDIALVTAEFHRADVVAGLTQLELTVHDGESRMRMRRQRVVESPRGPALCIESVFECGPGLFTVMELGRRAYRPLVRTRRIEAFEIAIATWQAANGSDMLDSGPRLRRTPALDTLCPRRGYAPFVTPSAPSSGPVENRRAVQGDAPGSRRVPTGVCVEAATPSET